MSGDPGSAHAGSKSGPGKKHFTVKQMILLCASLVVFFACSAADESATWGLENDVTIELGEAESALLDPYTAPVMPSPTGYGNIAANHGDRCAHSWPWTDCSVPHKRTVVIHNRTGSKCTGPYASDIQTSVANAITFWSNVANNQGWSVTADTANATPSATSGRVDVTILCGNRSDVGIGGTFLNAQSAPSSGSGLGQPSEVYGATVWIDEGDLSGWGAFVRATQQQRRNQVYNIAGHELGHGGFGLGHTPCSSQVSGTLLMGLGACEDLNNPSSWFMQSISGSPEINWIHDFQP